MRLFRLSFERRLLLLALLGGLPANIFLLAYVLTRDERPDWAWSLVSLCGLLWVGCALVLRHHVSFPLRTLSSLLGGLREGDYSIRARGESPPDVLGSLMEEVNTLATLMREQRLGALEASALLRTVMEQINLAVFTFDERQRLRLINRAGERLLAQPVERLLGRTAAELGLAAFLEGEAARTTSAAFAGGMGRWGMRRSSFRQGGQPHQLLVLADLSQALREEERQAWQSLLRVLGHELNNSLAPIKSISGSLASLLQRETLPDDWREDMERGLNVIGSRSEALSRFMQAYSKLARLPAPKLAPVEIGPLLRRLAGLETRLPITVRPGPEATAQADADQLEQLLINLLRNAVEAALPAQGGVRLGWSRAAGQLVIEVEDDGPGIANPANLFIPFFTTKPGGSGIGLILSRQIAEAHGGNLTLENRTNSQGCVARLRLPLLRSDTGQPG
jgi:nitrogen fixation/metabolism regulation signal transduction histidine kinase